MAINTLLGQVTDEQLRKLPGRVRNPERVQQHLEAFGLHLQGVSYRGIQDHFGWKAVSTAQNSVRRGEELAKDLDLDKEKIRLKLAAFFDELLEVTLKQVKHQVAEGQITQVADNQGNTTVTKRHGADPRLLAEASRGAIRFAEFCGLLDRAPEVSASTTLINLQAPLDGASFTEQWAQSVDVSSEPVAEQPALPEKPAAA